MEGLNVKFFCSLGFVDVNVLISTSLERTQVRNWCMHATVSGAALKVPIT